MQASDRVICVTCVDDCLMVAQDDKDLQNAISALRERGMDLEEENDICGFLGVKIERSEGQIKTEL